MDNNKSTSLHKRFLIGIFFLGVTCGVLAETVANGSALEAEIDLQDDNITSVQPPHEDKVLHESPYLSEIVVTPHQLESNDSQVSTNIFSPSLAADHSYINDSQDVESSNEMHKEIYNESFEISTSFSASVTEYEDSQHSHMLTSVSTGQMEQDFEKANVESHTHEAVQAYDGEPYSTTTSLLEELMNCTFTNATIPNKENDTQTSKAEDGEQLITSVSSPKVYQSASLDTTGNNTTIATTLSEKHTDQPLTFTNTTDMGKKTATQDGVYLITTVSSTRVYHTADLSTTENQSSISKALSEEYVDYSLPLGTHMSKETVTQTTLVDSTEQLITTVSSPEAQQSAHLYTAENQSHILTTLSEEYMDYPLPFTSSMSKESGSQTSSLDGAEQLITTVPSPEAQQSAHLYTAENQSHILTTLSEEYMGYPLPLTSSVSKESGSQTSSVDGTEQFITAVSSPEAKQTADWDSSEKQSSTATTLLEKYTDYPLPFTNTTNMGKENATQDAEHLTTTASSPKMHHTADLFTTENQSSISTALSEEYVNYSLPLGTHMSKETVTQTTLVDSTEMLITTASSPEVQQTADLYSTKNQSHILTTLSEEYMGYPLPLTSSMSKESGIHTSSVNGIEQSITAVSSLGAQQTADLDTSEKKSTTVTKLSEVYMDYPLPLTNTPSISKETLTQDEKQLITTVSSHEFHQNADPDANKNQSSIATTLLDDSKDHLHTTMDINKGANTQASWVYDVNQLTATAVPDGHQIDYMDTTENQHIIFDQNLELMMNSTESILIARDFLNFTGILANNVTLNTDGNDSSHETTTDDPLTVTFTKNESGRNFTADNYGSATRVGNEERNANEENSTEYAGLPIVSDNSMNITRTLLIDNSATISIENQLLLSESDLNTTTVGTEGYISETKEGYSNSTSHSENGSPSEYDMFEISTQRNSENLWRTEESTYESTAPNKLNGRNCENQENCEGEITESVHLLDSTTKPTDHTSQYHTNEFVSDATVTVVQDSVFSREVIFDKTDSENVTTEIYTVPLHMRENLSAGHQKRSTSDRNETEYPSSVLEDSDPDTEIISLVQSTSVEVSAPAGDGEQTVSDTVFTLQYPRHQNLTVYNWSIDSTQKTPTTDESVSYANQLNETTTRNHDMQYLSTSFAEARTSELNDDSYSVGTNPSLSVNISMSGHDKLSMVENLPEVTTPQEYDHTSPLFTSSNSDALHINESEPVYTNIYETMKTVYETLTENNTETSIEQNTYSSEFQYAPVIHTSDSEKDDLTVSVVHSFPYELTSEASQLFSVTSASDGSVLSQASVREPISFEISTQTPSSNSEVFPSSSHLSSVELYASVTNTSEYSAEELEHSLPDHTEGMRDSKTVSGMHSHITDYDTRLLTSELTEPTLSHEPFSREVTIKGTEISHAISTPSSLSSSSEAILSFDPFRISSELSTKNTSELSTGTAEYLTQESMHFTESRYPHTRNYGVQQYSQSSHSLYTSDREFSSLQDRITTEPRMQTLSDLETSLPSVDQVTAVFPITSHIQNATILSLHSVEEDTPVSSVEYYITTEHHQSSETQALPSFQQKHSISSTPRETLSSMSDHDDFFSYSSVQLVDTTATTHEPYTELHKNVTSTYLEESSVITEGSSISEVLLDGTIEQVSLKEASAATSSLSQSIPFHPNHSTVRTLQESADTTTETEIYTVSKYTAKTPPISYSATDSLVSSHSIVSTLQGSADTATETEIYTVSKDTVKTPHISHSVTDFLVSSYILEVTGTEMPSLKPKSTEVSTTEYMTCKYAKEFLEVQSEDVIVKQDYESLTTDQLNNTITVVFRITQGVEQIDLYTKRFTTWMVQVLLKGMKEHTTKSSSSDAPRSHGEASNGSRVELIYILPTPNIVSEDLVFTFIAVLTPSNDTVPLSEVIDAVLSDAEGMQNCMNLNLSYFIRGQYPTPLDVSQSLNQVWQKYGILLVTISVLTLLIVVILITAVIYLRCKSRRSVAYISDKDRLQCDLHASAEIGDLNRGSVILEDEVFEKDTSLVNGNHVLTIGDDEGWLVPINDVPFEDHDAPEVQDTKL